MIPQILLYFLPGYIALGIYRWFTNKKIDSISVAAISCAISYVGTAIIKWWCVYHGKDLGFWHTVLLTTLFCCLSVGIFAALIRTAHVNKFSSKLFKKTFYDTTIQSTINLKNGSTVTAVSHKAKCVYVGAYKTNDGNYIGLSNFIAYDIEDSHIIKDLRDDNTAYVLLKLSDIDILEIYS